MPLDTQKLAMIFISKRYIFDQILSKLLPLGLNKNYPFMIVTPSIYVITYFYIKLCIKVMHLKEDSGMAKNKTEKIMGNLLVLFRY